jgi:hypothetical protein
MKTIDLKYLTCSMPGTIIGNAKVFSPFAAHAEVVAEDLQAGDEDWTYEVVTVTDGWPVIGKAIQIFDEEGEFVSFWTE